MSAGEGGGAAVPEDDGGGDLTMMRLEWENPERLMQQVKSLLSEQAGRIRQVPDRAVIRGTYELLAAVKRAAPKKTGTFARTLNAKLERRPDGIQGVVGTWMQYAPYLEYGTGLYGPHKKAFVVKAVNARALRFPAGAVGSTIATRRPLYRGRGGGVTVDRPFVFRKQVTIRGMKPRAPFGKAMALFVPRFAQMIEEELARA